jgi:threonine dehydrogenase-like Zn-dependent dehydrogenase
MIAVYLENGRVSMREVPPPVRPHGFARIRLLTAGICNTDIELQRGYYSFEGIPGHEFVGEVLEADKADLVGNRVVGEINVTCGACDWCAKGLGRHCPTRSVLGIVKHPGAFAEQLTLPERNLHIVPDEISNEIAVFTEPLAAAFEILEQVSIPKGAPVAVLGDGKLGLLIAQVLEIHGARVHHFGRHEEKLRISEAAGIETELIDGKLPVAAYGWVVDATGSVRGLQQAISMTRPRGTLILKSTVADPVTVDTAGIVVNELNIVGSRCGPFEPALAILRENRIPVGDMIAAEYPLDRAAAAFAHAARRGTLKVLLQGHQM